jgi:GTP-binding protein Era
VVHAVAWTFTEPQRKTLGLCASRTFRRHFTDRPQMMNTRAGIVAVVGRPNAGKSTLLNRLVGVQLAITSPKPQSTRDRVAGIVSDETTQIVLVDTPGLLEPTYALQHSMRAAAHGAMQDADVILHLVDAARTEAGSLARNMPALEHRASGVSVILVFNKCDAITESKRRAVMDDLPGAMLVSARSGDGIPELLLRVRSLLPESPFLYNPDDLSTLSLRFIAAEMIREAALEQLDDEVPHSVACVIEEYREARSPIYIRAVVYVERDSQKRILIGAGGARIKAIGTSARTKIEGLAGGRVYLDLHVKVLANWRRDVAALARLGYRVPKRAGGRGAAKDSPP